jgi:hypothetical protein
MRGRVKRGHLAVPAADVRPPSGRLLSLD